MSEPEFDYKATLKLIHRMEKLEAEIEAMLEEHP